MRQDKIQGLVPPDLDSWRFFIFGDLGSAWHGLQEFTLRDQHDQWLFESCVPKTYVSLLVIRGQTESDTLDFISDMATAQYERSGTRASAHPDPNPDPDPSLGSAWHGLQEFTLRDQHDQWLFESYVPKTYVSLLVIRGQTESDTSDFISDMATAQYERSGTRASAHPDPNPDPDPELRIKSPNSVPDHRMQYLKSDVELEMGVRSIPFPYLFHTCSIPVPDQTQYVAHTHPVSLWANCGNQQASVIVPHPPDQVCDPDPPDQTA